ncbi:hypothetical protein OKW21_004518 [Catalinimonas alkaloidigena]|nr:hypothetical protein [Catalinimonas alkaloidigena]
MRTANNHLYFLIILLISIPCGVRGQTSYKEKKVKPNVVFIYADDLGRGFHRI